MQKNKGKPKIAVVTGARTGIGKATTDLFKKDGYQVIGLSKNSPLLEESFPCDVADEKSVQETFQAILKRFGRIDALINSAAISSTTLPFEILPTEWRKMFDVNVMGTYLCCQQAIAVMKNQRQGKIVNVSSIAGRAYSKSASISYTASKYAVVGLTRQLAAVCGPLGINVNCVCPSQTKTEMLMKHVSSEKQSALAEQVPLRRLADPQEVASVIRFLCSDEASYMNGAIVDINGGQL